MVLRTLNLVLTRPLSASSCSLAIRPSNCSGRWRDWPYFENSRDTAAAGTGFVAGAIGGLFNFGKDIGNRFNPFDCGRLRRWRRNASFCCLDWPRVAVPLSSTVAAGPVEATPEGCLFFAYTDDLNGHYSMVAATPRWSVKT